MARPIARGGIVQARKSRDPGAARRGGDAIILRF
jgi:hypothetical protein